jgi:hypothetical protein
VVCPVFDWIDDQQAEVAVDLKERARNAGVRSPLPVCTPHGGLVRRVLDQNWRVDAWMDLGPTPVVPVTGFVARAPVSLWPQCMRSPRTDRPIQGQWVNAADRPTDAQWAALLERASAARRDWTARLVGLSSTIMELSAITAKAAQDSIVITNCDLGINSVRIGGADDLVVIHWDFAGPMGPASPSCAAE